METVCGVLVILLCGSLGSGFSVTDVRLKCNDYDDEFPEDKTYVPSVLADLNAKLTVNKGDYVFNVSWAIAVDSTLKYIQATVITISPKRLKCEYVPPLKDVHIPDNQTAPIWFHHTTPYPFHADSYLVEAVNIPLPPPHKSHNLYKYLRLSAPRIPAPKPTKHEDQVQCELTTSVPSVGRGGPSSVGGSVICGGLIVCAMLLLFGYVTYKVCGTHLATRYKKVGPGANGPRVPVLVVYPAESGQFQCAVGALVEFLQQYGGCRVAVDMWQQGSVAKLGPMRWLLEQVQAARTVLIVAAQPSSLPSPQPLSIPGASIPAAAQDLYPLTLNLVAGQAKNSSDLAKFWVVTFGKSASLTSELRACQTFSLMKDLNKLCQCLHKHKQDDSMKIADLFLRGNLYSRDSTEKLRAAVQALNGRQVSGAKGQEAVGTFENV